MNARQATTVEVDIFGGTYQVRGEKDAEYLRELAELVDGKMREIAEKISAADTAKVAILAALNLADELSQGRRQQEGDIVEIRERMTQLTEELAAALAEGTPATTT